MFELQQFPCGRRLVVSGGKPQSILAQGFSLKTSIASAWWVRFSSFFLFVMLRGWSKAPVLDGWVQIIRGTRPKSEKWPKAGQQKVPAKRNQSAVCGGHPHRRDSGSETVAFCSAAPVASQKQRPPRQVWRSNDCKELSLRWEKAICCPLRCRQPSQCTHEVQGSPGARESRGMQGFPRGPRSALFGRRP